MIARIIAFSARNKFLIFLILNIAVWVGVR